MSTEYTQAVDPKWGIRETPGLVVGRDKKVVPPQEVEDLASIGCRDREIADWFGIKEQTLRYQFKDYLAKGRENLKQSLRRAQLSLALGGNATMLIWLGKNILLQSDAPTQSQDKQPLPWSDEEDSEIEDTPLTPEAKAELREKLRLELAQLDEDLNVTE